MADARFLPQYRIRKAADFQKTYRRRNSAADQQIVVYGGRNGLPYPRIGLSASRRLGGAVLRNRWKRLLREAFRLARPQLPPGVDLIVIPRPGAEPSLATLLESLSRLASRVAKRLEQ